MKKGDKVRWKSQAGGYEAEKIGEILVVVPAGTRISKVIKQEKLGEYRKMFDGLMSRDHESYLIKVVPGTTGKAAPVLYWPRVSALQVIP